MSESIIFLDTDVPENSDEDRHITDNLYGGCSSSFGSGSSTRYWRNAHVEKMVQQISKFHMNEGHSSLLCRSSIACGSFDDPISEVRSRSVLRIHLLLPDTICLTKFGE